MYNIYIYIVSLYNPHKSLIISIIIIHIIMMQPSFSPFDMPYVQPEASQMIATSVRPVLAHTTSMKSWEPQLAATTWFRHVSTCFNALEVPYINAKKIKDRITPQVNFFQ